MGSLKRTAALMRAWGPRPFDRGFRTGKGPPPGQWCEKSRLMHQFRKWRKTALWIWCVFAVRIVDRPDSLKGMLIGYARVSTQGQNLDRQIAALRSAGCEKIYREKASGKAVRGRPELEKAIDALGTEDVLVVAEWDRATRSMMDGIQIMLRVANRGSAIRVLDKPHLDLTTPIGRGFLAFLSALAEDERERIVGRAAEGRAAARAKGAKFGPKPKLTEHQQARALERLAADESSRAIARDMGVSHSTILRLKNT